MSESTGTAKVDGAARKSKHGHAVMDHAPRVEMGGKSIAIIGGAVATIPARDDEERDEFEYERGNRSKH